MKLFVTYGGATNFSKNFSIVEGPDRETCEALVRMATGGYHAFTYTEEEFAGQQEKYGLTRIPAAKPTSTLGELSPVQKAEEMRAKFSGQIKKETIQGAKETIPFDSRPVSEHPKVAARKKAFEDLVEYFEGFAKAAREDALDPRNQSANAYSDLEWATLQMLLLVGMMPLLSAMKELR